MAEDTAPGTPVTTRIPRDLYSWLEGEQDRIYVETGAKLPIPGVVRALLQKLMDSERPKKKAPTR